MSDNQEQVVSPSSIQSPSSTITPTHFQHRTTSAAPTNSLIDTATPAINAVPIELDSTPVSATSASAFSSATSPQQRAAASSCSSSGKSGESAAGKLKNVIQGAVAGVEGKIGKVMGQEGSNLRVHDDAVMAGPPGTPGPEDFEAAEGEMLKS